ncbi:MAG: glycosyltransferase family 4 protein [Anaerolineae bacterium]|nr:glycosyltransferase family 4 protein [Anaerolineae bacterium]
MKMFLVCSGLGQINRGFETFTLECFEALTKVPSLDATLFKGGGRSQDKAIKLWNFSRNTSMAKRLGKTTGRSAYYIEQLTFTLSLLPYIRQKKPDVIFFSDGTIGNLLWHWRRTTKQMYKLLFSNGGPLSPPFSRWDYVHQLTPSHLQTALDAGEPVTKQSMIPYGIQVNNQLQIMRDIERQALRRQLGLPAEKPIILTVGTINQSHKRMDYVIREVAALREPRPYLVMLGQFDEESAEVISLGNQLLGRDNFQAKTVPYHKIAKYYQIADAFVLASLNEGFGRVLLEAMSHGLPCLVHDYDVTRFVLGQEGYFADFRATGSLAELIKATLTSQDKAKKLRRHQSVYKRFSWDTLRPMYVDMILRCAKSCPPY